MSEPKRFADLNPPARLLFGTGPTNPDPRVLRALGLPILGQFDPAFTEIMKEVQELCRFVFRTQNVRTFPVSGTSRAGLEAALCSLIEPGDSVAIGIAGRFGELLAEISRRCGAEIIAVEAAWGKIIEPDAVRSVLTKVIKFEFVGQSSQKTFIRSKASVEPIGSYLERFAGTIFWLKRRFDLSHFSPSHARKEKYASKLLDL